MPPTDLSRHAIILLYSGSLQHNPGANVSGTIVATNIIAACPTLRTPSYFRTDVVVLSENYSSHQAHLACIQENFPVGVSQFTPTAFN